MDRVFECCLSIFWVFLEVIAIFVFADTFMSNKIDRKAQTLSFICVVTVNSLCACLEIDSTLRQIVAIVTTVCWTGIVFKGSVLRHTLVIVMYYIFSSIVDITVSYGLSAILGISFSELVWKKLLYICVVTLAKLISIFVAFLVRRFRTNKHITPIRSTWLLLTLLFPAISLVMLVAIFEGYRDSHDLPVSAFAASGILAAANVAIIYLIQVMERNTQKEKELVLLSKQMAVQTKSIMALEASYRAQRKATHEFLHHIQTMDSLLTANKTDALREYLSQLKGGKSTRLFCVNSRNPIIDAVINQHYQAAKENDIDFLLQVNDLSDIPVPMNAIVVLLSNLLDNAVEACQKFSGNRVIQCRIIKEETLHIAVRNTSDPVVIIGEKIPTTKEPKEGHGFGIANIRHIIKQLNAECAFEYKDGWFRFGAEIPISG